MNEIPDYIAHDDLGMAKPPKGYNLRDVKTGKFTKRPKPKK